METKLSVTFSHIIPNILCGLNLYEFTRISNNWTLISYICIWNHIRYQKQKKNFDGRMNNWYV